MVAKVVERQMGVALWRQIADRIRLAISNGDYDATGMVPPETALAAEFGVIATPSAARWPHSRKKVWCARCRGAAR